MNALESCVRNTTPLAHSALVVTITDLVAEYELRHAFRNDGPATIEAVYSFPVPLDSAFMGMEATLAGEHLFAQILPSTQASERYDDAITDGDSAVLLERIEPGMLCVNLGNLKPGEVGETILRFAAPLRCAGGTARFSLPLVHRPRYGRSQIEELVEPRHDFAVEHPLEAVVRVRGLLSNAPVSCATHAARFSTDDTGTQLRLNQAMLDRDLVLVFDLPVDFAGYARMVRDGDAAIGMLGFNVPVSLRKSGPCDLCLVMDGSGSMTGDAIAQSRAALSAVAGMLGDEDRIQVLRFGSKTVPLFRRPLKASARVRNAMVDLAGTIDSDLGGTEIGEALARGISDLTGLTAPTERRRAIILVTDGAVEPFEIQDAKASASKCGIRIFVVAVGSSAGADVLAPLSTDTKGVIERAVPAESIDEVVLRQLQRAREPEPIAINVDWGDANAAALPIAPVYAGDAVTAIALLADQRNLLPRVRIDGGQIQQVFRLDKAEDAPALRALAGHVAWQCASDEDREVLAVRYGLVTDETSAVLVKVRADGQKVEGLPIVVPVAHMVPEGMVACMRAPRPVALSMVHALPNAASGDWLDTPAFLRSQYDNSSQVSEHRSPNSQGKRATRRESPLVNLDPEILCALAKALAQLLLDEGDSEVTTQHLLALIAPAWRDQVAAYLAARCPKGFNERSAATLLRRLLKVTRVELSDDQEAQFAVMIELSANKR